ncbi:hypothetical protein AOQ71_04335 [Bradyrhizobium manausense]|uniref:Uncharacterized protein n=1 Tax=Bradyrhizobium manausense TaxID=989370 RepID=A0A0R3E8R8_9BRAD|nr:hypothetical protein AOQ71_04335 [Bradyrhizobium manausense]
MSPKVNALVCLPLNLCNIIEPKNASRPCDEHAPYSKHGNLGSQAWPKPTKNWQHEPQRNDWSKHQIANQSVVISAFLISTIETMARRDADHS